MDISKIQEIIQEKITRDNQGLLNPIFDTVIIENETSTYVNFDNIFDTFDKLYQIHYYTKGPRSFVQLVKGNKFSFSTLWVNIIYETAYCEGGDNYVKCIIQDTKPNIITPNGY